ncbi:MAG TPA: hypothetical protein VIG74_03635, partial [Alphaproteobacteria bacterium]
MIGHGVDIAAGANDTLTIGTMIFGTGMYSSGGQIGIGAAPSTMFDVAGPAEATRFQFDSNTHITGPSGAIAFATSNATRATINDTGLGIGLVPDAPLDVNGNAEISGHISADRFMAYASGSSASNPAFTFAADNDTGLFHAGADQLGFALGGATEATLTTTALTVGGAGLFSGEVRGDSFDFNASNNSGLFYASGSGVNLNVNGATSLFADTSGNIGIGLASPAVKLDVGGPIRVGATAASCGVSLYGAVRYSSGDVLSICSSVTGDWETIGTSGGGGGGSGGLWTNNTTYITRGSAHVVDNAVPLPAALEGAGTRLVWYPNKAVFRAGSVTGTQWDDANIGSNSTAFGLDAIASAVNSFSVGSVTTAGGTSSVALGNQATASGANSFAFGLGSTAGTPPEVSAAKSLGIFMGDQGGLNLNASNIMLLAGGSLVIDPDQTAAGNIALSRAGLAIDVEGDIAAIEYCDKNGNNCFTATDIAAGATGSPGNDRELVFNSSGTLWTDTGLVFTSSGYLGIGTSTPQAQLDVAGTGALITPRGNTAQRPAGVDGMLRYNSTNGKFEGYQAGAWQDILTGAAAMNAAGADREIQFNSNGVLEASPTYKLMADGDLLLTGTYTGTASVPVSGGGVRMFFDTQKASFRVGRVPGTEWDNGNIGDYSTAMGYSTTASGEGGTALGSTTLASGWVSTAMGYTTVAAGDYSNAFGNQVNISATGDASAAFGLTTTAPATDPIVSGAQSFALFMGNHSAVNFAAANTVGFFGGKLVIDPAVPATQLSARSVLDVGAATDAIVFPSGTTGQRPGSPVNGMMRYNSGSGKFEAYQAGAWQDILTGSASAAGADREIQFNSGNGFAADSSFVYSAGGWLGLGTATPAAELDVAGTGALITPRGDTAQRPASPVNGMLRYNSDSGKFEAYQAGAWQDILTGSASSALSSITAATTTNTIDSLNFAQAWNWSTLSTETAMAMNANAITSGKMLDLGSSATAFTGTMANLTLSGNNAANTGTVLKATVSGASSAAVPLMATNLGAGLSLRVNDQTGDADTTPFVVDASGNVGVGTSAPQR